MPTPFTEEERTVFLNAYLRYRDSGDPVRAAYNRAKCDLLTPGVAARVPGWSTFCKWLAPAAGTSDETAGTEEQQPEAAAPDYGPGLAYDLLRLYRRRSETDVDTICDRLFPDLLATQPPAED